MDMFTQEDVDFTNKWMIDLDGEDLSMPRHISSDDSLLVLVYASKHKAGIVEYLKCRKNLSSVFQGIDELQQCFDVWEDYQNRLMYAIDNGDIGYPEPPECDKDHFIALYPQAYGYILAHLFFESDNHVKSRIGAKAMTRLMNGQPANQVIPRMQQEWEIERDRNIE